jgi:hypothetical protein
MKRGNYIAVILVGTSILKKQVKTHTVRSYFIEVRNCNANWLKQNILQHWSLCAWMSAFDFACNI